MAGAEEAVGADHWISASLCPIGSTTCTSLGAPGTVEGKDHKIRIYAANFESQEHG